MSYNMQKYKKKRYFTRYEKYVGYFKHNSAAQLTNSQQMVCINKKSTCWVNKSKVKTVIIYSIV